MFKQCLPLLLTVLFLFGCTDSVKDADNDGIPDPVDAFPNDPNEHLDSDKDGVGDNSDAFPNDPNEQMDSDNDGVGDNSDAFPQDPTEQKDSDGDGLGDNADKEIVFNWQFLVPESGLLNSYLYNPKIETLTNINVLSAPQGFELKQDGSYTLTTGLDENSPVKDLIITANNGALEYKYQVSFIKANDLIEDGYTSKGITSLSSALSITPEESINIHINANVKDNNKLYITDVNNRIVKEVQANYKPQMPSNEEPWLHGFGYDISAKVELNEVKSGLYYVNGSEKIFFVVKNPSKKAKISLVLPTNTQNAYSCAGGRSLYTCVVNGKRNSSVPTLSFLRPQKNPESSPWGTHVIKLTRPFLSWLFNETAYRDEVQYFADHDLDNYDEFSHSNLLIIPGHNEYWSIKAQDNFVKFLDSGKNSLIAGGNIMWWHSRYEAQGTKLTSVKWPPESDKNAIKGEETTYFHTLKDKSGHTRAAYHSIGGIFSFGGYHENKWDNTKGKSPFRIIRPNSEIFANTGVEFCSELDLSDNLELDGAVVSGFDVNGFPHVNYKQYSYIHNFEILAYAWSHYGKYNKVGTIHALQRKPESGTTLQIGSIGGASFGFTNENNAAYKKMLTNSIELMVEGNYPFESEVLYKAEQKAGFTFPHSGSKVIGFEACPK